MHFYTPPLDPMASLTRIRLRAMGKPRDMAGGVARMALHLSELEYEQLCALNPDSLGIKGDDVLMNLYWRAFCEAPESKPFRVQERV